MKFLVCILALFSTTALADMKQEIRYDLGLNIAPSVAPELGYDRSVVRGGIEFGVSFFEYKSHRFLSIKGLTEDERTPMRFLRIGLGLIVDQPVFIFSPVSIRVKEHLFISPTFGFGKYPYSMYSLTYELN